jgi:hypothetical protein
MTRPTLWHVKLWRFHILIVLSLRPDTILLSSYCRQYTPLEFSDLQLIRCRLWLPVRQLFSIVSMSWKTKKSLKSFKKNFTTFLWHLHSWPSGTTSGKTNAADVWCPVVEWTNTVSIPVDRPNRATANLFALCVRSTFSTAYPRRWHATILCTLVRRHTTNRRPNTIEYFQRCVPVLFLQIDKWKHNNNISKSPNHLHSTTTKKMSERWMGGDMAKKVRT